MRLLRASLLALIVAQGAGLLAQRGATSASIAARIDEILAQPAARRTYWGVLVRDLSSGETVYERNADKLFLPASNVKLYSTALALARLGADYTYTTAVTTDAAVDESGALGGDLRLVGGGDPNLSARLLPYRNQSQFGPDPLEPVRKLARQIRDAGVRRVEGDVIGDDSRYVWQPYPRGWGYADTLHDYGSPVSALVFNDNVITVRVTPGGPGAPARLLARPALPYYQFSNRTATVADRYVTRGLAARWGEGQREVVLAGQISAESNGRRFAFPATDPAQYAALALRKALTDLGVDVEGGAKSAHELPDRLPSLRSRTRPRVAAGRVVAQVTSLGLSEAVRVVNKVSQNLHAEMLLREVAYREAGIGSWEAAIASLRKFLAEAGLGSGEHYLRDGSGLSRHNLVAPRATVRLLESMWDSPEREAYVDSLPVAGHDGTLDWRFRRSAARARIRAKTGSMSSVLALSGYAEADGGRTYAFSIFANNFGMSSSSTRHLIDSVAATIIHGAYLAK